MVPLGPEESAIARLRVHRNGFFRRKVIALARHIVARAAAPVSQASRRAGASALTDLAGERVDIAQCRVVIEFVIGAQSDL